MSTESYTQRSAAASRVALPVHALVVGLGKTGLSVVRYLRGRGVRVTVTDSRAEPPGRALLADIDPAVRVHAGGFDTAALADVDQVVLSPGVAPVGTFFEAVRARGLPLIGDIELFARAVGAPVAGVTGTNGKSTVTTLLGQMAEQAGRRVKVGGNLGPPALDLLGAPGTPAAELYVLELSSFQLDTTVSLALAAGAVLNVTADHLDRYATLDAYAASKAHLFDDCDCAVVNLDDERVAAMPRAGQRRLGFALRARDGAQFWLERRAAAEWLVARGEPLLPLAELALAGRHNAANALAALALAEALGLPRAACLQALRGFRGLSHRMQCVAEIRGVRYIDDSKGTNVGATLAAVAGLRGEGSLLVIAGGEGKGQDFAPLRAGFAGAVRCALLIGRDAHRLGDALAGVCECHYCQTLESAVALAADLARPGETVLLSPACASLDMFRDYAHRGEVFAGAVRRLAA